MFDKQCQFCNVLFVVKNQRSKQRFCSRGCVNLSQKSGLLKLEKEQYFFKKYGVKNPFASEATKEIIRKTWKQKYGVDNPAKSSIIQQKIKNTSIERYGTESPTQRGSSVRDRIKKTNILKYGVESTFGSPNVIEKCRQTTLKNHGVTCVFKKEGYYDRLEEIMIERYGVKNAYSIPKNILAAHTTAANEKRWSTFKKNKTIVQSNIERTIVDFIEKTYGTVERHITVNGWSIDAFICTLNVYVQIDGVYWHCLDGSLDVARLSLKKIDKVRVAKFSTDRAQDAWFKEQNKLLVRITDVEWKNAGDKKHFLSDRLEVANVKKNNDIDAV